MLLDLRKVFLTEDEVLVSSYELVLSDMECNGCKPLNTPIKVSAKAVNRAGVVNLAVSAKFGYSAPCDRCGEETITSFDYGFDHTLVLSLEQENEGDYIETPDYILDLDELVTSDILLELPSKHLCSEDCKGVCPKCGANLNKFACKCDLHEIDPRLEALKSLL